MRRLAFEGIQEYEGYHGCRSFCYLRGYAEYNTPPLVIATEMPDNPGTSITNQAERLATYVLGKFRPDDGGDGDRIIWIEHYPGDRDSKERFRLVSFHYDREHHRFVRPAWADISRPAVEDLIGGLLGTLPLGEATRFDRLYQPSAN